MVHYADGGVVCMYHRYIVLMVGLQLITDVRAYPEDHVLVEVPCWDWRHGRASSICFPLPCVLAYAANQKLASQPYDGNLGLAIHGWVMQHYLHCRMYAHRANGGSTGGVLYVRPSLVESKAMCAHCSLCR